MRGNLFAVAVDLVVLTVRDAELSALLVRRDNQPFAGWWGLPGGFVLPNEDLLDTATSPARARRPGSSSPDTTSNSSRATPLRTGIRVGGS